MASERVERRLTAILAADIAGYSRLTGLDEEGTHVQLQDHLSTLVDPKIAEHRGRVVKNTGDGLLAEFNSVVWTQCAALLMSSAGWPSAMSGCQMRSASSSAWASMSATSSSIEVTFSAMA